MIVKAVPVRPSHSAVSSKRRNFFWVYCCEGGHERDVDPASLPLSCETPVPFMRRT